MSNQLIDAINAVAANLTMGQVAIAAGLFMLFCAFKQAAK